MVVMVVVGVDVAGPRCPDHLSPLGGLGTHYSPRTLVRLATASELAERELGSGSISSNLVQTRCAGYIREHQPSQEEEEEQERGGEGNTSGSFGRERRMQKRRLLLEVLAVLLDSSIKQCIAAAGGCQEGKFGTDRCSQGGGGGGGEGGWAPPASSRKEIGSKNSVLALPTIRFLLSAAASEFYISQIYTERAGFLPCPIQ